MIGKVNLMGSYANTLGHIKSNAPLFFRISQKKLITFYWSSFDMIHGSEKTPKLTI